MADKRNKFESPKNSECRRPNGKSRKGKTNNRCTKGNGTNSKTYTNLKEGAGASSTNDYRWYTANTALSDAAARLPMVWPLGQPLTFDRQQVTSYTYNAKSFTVPGIAAIAVAPTIGYISGPHDPINVAATTEYAFVRHVNSGSRNYDAVDLMKYNVAMSSIYMMIGHLMRIYGIARQYSGYNRYLPETLLKALGVSDPETVASNLVNLEYSINMLIQKVATLAVPNTMPFFNRQATLFQNVYAEDNSPYSQIYALVPDGYYRWDDLEGTTLSYVSLDLRTPGTSYTWSNWCEKVNEMIDHVYRSEDCGIMSGDILHAYGTSGIIHLQEMPATYTTPLLVDTAVLNQIRNANVISINPSTNNIIINMDDKTAPYLTCKPACASSQAGLLAGRMPLMLNWNTGDNTDGLLYEATRLHAMCDMAGNVISGTEIVTGCNVWQQPYFNWSSAGKTYTEPLSVPGYYLLLDDDDVTKYTVPKSSMELMLLLRTFRYSPVIPVYDKASANTFNFVGFMNDINNYQQLEYSELQRLHETAIISLFNVPLIGRV